MLSPGQKAPDFAFPAVRDGDAELLELFRIVESHRAVVLLFYPADFVPTCTAELLAVRDAGWHECPSLAVVGLSGDSLFSHAAYADRFDLPFPLVSDYHGGVAESYGLLAEEWEAHYDIPRRATVVLDGWDVAAVEATDDALEAASPAPVERAVDALRVLGVDVRTPAVDYAI